MNWAATTSFARDWRVLLRLSRVGTFLVIFLGMALVPPLVPGLIQDPGTLPPPAENVQTPNCDARQNRCKSWTPYCDNNHTGVDPIYGCEDSDHATHAGSRHAGGVNACMGDGSVRFFSNTIDPLLWYSLFTIAGGEPGTLP